MKTAEIIVNKAFKKFVVENLSNDDKDRLIHELSLITSGNSIDYSPVENALFNDLCYRHNLGSPKRYKAMWLARNRGGVRVIFAFDSDYNMVIIHIDYRDNNPYRDGR